VVAIKRWLEQCQQPWLLIFDNADEISMLQPYLPQRGNGSLLLTTRSHAVGSLAASIEVENMGLTEGTLFLLHRAQRQHADEAERDEAINVVIALDGFPLALDQAGAYIEETGCSFGNYLQTYQTHHQELLARRGMQTTNYPDSVATTWSLSFRKIAQTSPAAAELLRLCAFLASDAIPEELLKKGAACWPSPLQQAVGDHLAFNHLLENLLKWSLIKRLAAERALSIHRLVQVVQRDRMEAEEQRQWAERVVRAVHAVFPREPRGDVSCWPQCLRYLEQVQACYMLIQERGLLLPEAAELLDRAGTYLSEHASYTLAEQLFQRALRIEERRLGPEHPDVALPLIHLAELYLKQGEYEHAEFSYQRALTICEQHLGPEHPLVADPLNGLANIYYYQGKYEQVEPLYRRALSIREQQLGPEHPDLAHPLTNLAQLYSMQSMYAEAEPLYQRALAIWEQQLGPEHSLVAYPLAGLAELYLKQGKYERAQISYQRVFAIWEQQLGPEHFLVAYPLAGLAQLCKEQGKFAEAEPLFQRALSIQEHSSGEQPLVMAETLYNFADFRKAQNRYQEAVSLYQRALAMREQVLGVEHPKTAEARERLQAALVALERTEEVEKRDRV
jgi:tetratricopeptide (TPR) repeat protein